MTRYEVCAGTAPTVPAIPGPRLNLESTSADTGRFEIP